MRIQPLVLASRAAVFAILSLVGALPLAGVNTAPIRLDLDATQAPTGVLHAHMTIPATAGSLTLAYPKWIPGEHAPNGPLGQVVRDRKSVV